MKRRREPAVAPALREVVALWPKEYQFDFEEQAAIRQFLDNKPREVAEREAYRQVGEKYMAQQRRDERRRR